MERHVRAHVFIVNERDEVLVLRQAGGRRWWELPGGELRPGERAAEAVVRETREEAGVHLENPALLRQWTYINQRPRGVFRVRGVRDADRCPSEQ
jgi:8-oxo-dGTP pyrophosphatase MutT (NUDIX family)